MYSELIGNYKKHRIKSLCDNKLTINSPSNMMRQFTNNVKEVGMILGQLFIPLMQKVMPVVNGVTIAIKRLLTNIAGFMGVKLDLSSFGQGYTQIEDEFDGIEESVDGATEAIDKFKSHTLGIDELNVYNPDTSGADTSGLDNTIDLTEQIIDATEEYEKVWNEAFSQMENKAEAIADVFSEMFKPFENIFENIAVGDWFAAGQGVSDLAVGILNFFKDAIAQVNWSEVGQAIGDFFAGIDWSEVLKSAIELLAEAIKSGVELIFSTASSGDFATTAMATAMGIWGLKKFTGLFGLGKGASAGTAGGLFGGINLKSIFKLMPNALVAMPGMAGELWRSIENLLDGTIFDTNTWTGKIKEIDDAVMGALENTFAWDETSSLWKSAEADFEAGGLRSILGFAKGVGSGFLLIAEPIKDAILGLYDVYDTARPKLALSVLENVPEESAVSSAIISGGKIASGYIEGFNSTIVTGATNGVNAMLNNIEKILSKSGNITKPLQDSLILTEDKFNKLIKKANELNGTEINIPINVAVEYGAINSIVSGAKSALGIQAYEVGGFPEDGLFFANHNELVGQFSNGKTAVANNGQIVEGIEGGVERAVARVLAPYLADIARNTRETADKDLSVNIGDRDIARANNRGQRSLGYQLIT